MKVQLTLLLSLFAFVPMLSGQISFSHSLGGSIYIGEDASVPGIMYSPRVNLVEFGDEGTISLGTHLGMWLEYNSQAGASAFALDAPLMAEVNFGMAANPYTSSSFGGYAGIGYGISSFGSAGAFGSFNGNGGIGVVVNGGIRAIILGAPVGLRASYLLNNAEGGSNVFSLGAYYCIGSY